MVQHCARLARLPCSSTSPPKFLLGSPCLHAPCPLCLCRDIQLSGLLSDAGAQLAAAPGVVPFQNWVDMDVPAGAEPPPAVVSRDGPTPADDATQASTSSGGGGAPVTVIAAAVGGAAALVLVAALSYYLLIVRPRRVAAGAELQAGLHKRSGSSSAEVRPACGVAEQSVASCSTL
jgi:hypothetical protein